MATGTATLNFGTTAERRASASVDVTGQSGLSSTSYLEAFTMSEATADQTATMARFDPVRCDTEYLSATSFRIYGTVVRGHTYGDRNARWVSVP